MTTEISVESKEIAKSICGVGPWKFFNTGTQDTYDKGKIIN